MRRCKPPDQKRNASVSFSDRQSDDERAVSPVIGVVLLVGISVILAAVVGTVVMSMSSSLKDPAPNADFEYEIDQGASTVTVRHIGGEKVDHTRLTIEVNGAAASTQFGSDVTAGDSVDVSASSGDRIQLVYETEGGTSEIISTYEVP